MDLEKKKYWLKRFIDEGILNEEGIWIYSEQMGIVKGLVDVLERDFNMMTRVRMKTGQEVNQ